MHSSLPASGQLRRRLLVAFAGVAILAAAAYLSLVIVTRIDELFFPGQGLSVGGLSNLPGVQDDSDNARRINVLVMGLDRRPSEGNAPTRTDTMFVLTIDSKTKSAGMLGIPRDLWVEIPARSGDGYFNERINTAFVYGEQTGYPGGGARLAEKVIERTFGISIDHYMIIDFPGFIEVIDSIGGVDIYVEEEIYDPLYSRTELPGDYYPLEFHVGLQHMGGQTALDYSRTRFDNSDLDRIHRQQQVIFAAIDKALELDLVRVDRLVDLWGQYKDAIVTDVNDIQAPGFARLAAQIDPDRIVALSLANATVGWTAPTGAQVLLLDEEMAQRIVNALFGEAGLSDEVALVEVQDGPGTAGLAPQVVDYLGTLGFEPELLAASSNSTTIQPLTEIIDFTSKTDTVGRLAALLQVAPEQVRVATADDIALRTVLNADVVVILGADAQARDYTAEASGG
jgi:LCP family protein required for cell wall assembly